MDPVAIVEKIGNPIVVAIGSITFVVATMGINIVANFVSPAYDIANLHPSKIDFRLGGLITSILSVLVCPWLFVSSPQAITLFVSIFGSVLGPLFGVDHRRLLPGQAPDDGHRRPLHACRPPARSSTTAAGTAMPSSRWRRPARSSIGLALLGAYRLIFNVGDWGWLIGAPARPLLVHLSCRGARSAPPR